MGYSVPFHTSSELVQAKVAGYRGPSSAHTLMFRLLITAADYPQLAGSPFTPTTDRIRDLAFAWNDLLPLGCGKGPEVEAVLRRDLWCPPTDRDDLHTRLIAADKLDRDTERAEKEMHEEDAPLLQSMRQHYVRCAVEDLREAGAKINERAVRRQFLKVVSDAGPIVQSLLA